MSSTFIKVWVHILSAFVITTYLHPLKLPQSFVALQPIHDMLIRPVMNFFALVPTKLWSFLHAISGMILGGSILCTALVEWIWPDQLETLIKDQATNGNMYNRRNDWDDISVQQIVNQMATKTLFPMEGMLVLPGVTGSMISGIAQSFVNYGSLRLAPIHVKSSLHLMFLFGLWWVWTDRKSQKDILELTSTSVSPTVEEKEVKQKRNSTSTIQSEMLAVWKRRRFYNAVSCLFVLALYAIMVLKPGFVVSS
ncbi:hypothetical protein IV203_030343 [Nitzschia inconspicua]|uniref:Uncharacterized protein n=1 Tax=Nitzschia inconspicua TaxID=303405 RepID=A0A9K3LT60_9STRA|nr:hypothetical protein IV203_030343 [Nitzschia inconspicua]